jgi:hypothetical protein
VPISGEQVRQAVDVIARDLHATLGWEFARAEAVALREAQVVAEWYFDIAPLGSLALLRGEGLCQGS